MNIGFVFFIGVKKALYQVALWHIVITGHAEIGCLQTIKEGAGLFEFGRVCDLGEITADDDKIRRMFAHRFHRNIYNLALMCSKM